MYASAVDCPYGQLVWAHLADIVQVANLAAATTRLAMACMTTIGERRCESGQKRHDGVFTSDVFSFGRLVLCEQIDRMACGDYDDRH